MKINVRRSTLKHRRMTSFLRRMRTKGGRNILAQRRRKWKPKTFEKVRKKRRKYYRYHKI
ncbi:MAG: 50S ribosomal protein L34 [Planctomycetales bacterium]|nr:50S ribosomal protein L34 [Planctomycetales bacterium]